MVKPCTTHGLHRFTWKPTQFKYISQRGDRFRVRRRVDTAFESGTYFASLREAKDFVTSSGLDLIKDRSRREPMTDMVEKARHYLDWVAQTKYEPGDTTIANSIRGGGNGFISRAAPCTYMLGIEGKEAPWWGALLQAYHMLSHREKSMLTLLTSDVQAEWMRAAKLQHRVYSEALRAASRPAFHRARGWWSFEVQHNVSQHMGWLPKALARGILKKMSRGHGINLGQQGLAYRILPLTPQLAQKYKDMAVLTTRLGTMRAAKTFDEYAENRATLLTMPDKYHNLWYFRSFSELERRAACGAQRLRVGPSVTIAQWVDWRSIISMQRPWSRSCSDWATRDGASTRRS